MTDLSCRKCGADLENFNILECYRLSYCPQCGTRALKKQTEALARQLTNAEIEGMIKERLLDLLQDNSEGGIRAEDLANLAWETENYDGAVFYSNYVANRFIMRHMQWADDALSFIYDEFHDDSHFVKMRAKDSDGFLVAAFIFATGHFLRDQAEVAYGEGVLTKKRIAEIKRLVRATAYDGGF
jgi:DNA-directed RNA polymerase subunit RPC12/RpoP